MGTHDRNPHIVSRNDNVTAWFAGGKRNRGAYRGKDGVEQAC